MSNYAKCFQNSSKSPNLTSIDIQEMNLAFYSIGNLLGLLWDECLKTVAQRCPEKIALLKTLTVNMRKYSWWNLF